MIEDINSQLREIEKVFDVDVAHLLWHTKNI